MYTLCASHTLIHELMCVMRTGCSTECRQQSGGIPCAHLTLIHLYQLIHELMCVMRTGYSATLLSALCAAYIGTCINALQRMCCSVLQCVAVCCSVLHILVHVSTHCNTLHHTASDTPLPADTKYLQAVQIHS